MTPGRASGWDRSADPEKDPALIPDPATTEVPAQLRNTIEEAMARYPERHSAAIPALHAAQQVHGWCSPEAIEQVACLPGAEPEPPEIEDVGAIRHCIIKGSCRANR